MSLHTIDNGAILVAQELALSFLPDVEQRLWRTVMRRNTNLHERVRYAGRGPACEVLGYRVVPPAPTV